MQVNILNRIVLLQYIVLVLISCTPQNNTKKVDNKSEGHDSIENQLAHKYDHGDRTNVPIAYIDSVCNQNNLDLAVNVCMNSKKILDLIKNVEFEIYYEAIKGFDYLHVGYFENPKDRKSFEYSSYMVNRENKEFYDFDRLSAPYSRKDQDTMIVKAENYTMSMTYHRRLLNLGVYYSLSFNDDYGTDNIICLFLDNNKGIVFHIPNNGKVSRSFQYLDELLQSRKVCENFYFYNW